MSKLKQRNNKGVIKLILSVPYVEVAEATNGGVLCKKVFLKISYNSQEKTCARVSF